MISLSVLLKHYKRRDIQEEMVEHAKDKEVVAKFNDTFGKRPDTLHYPNDVIELVKQGATSFHASEELWRNPLHLNPNMKKKELDNLRIGWDLVLDIDCPYWEYSKLISHLMVKALRQHGVTSISCKFSGNKGFHIGVPFEAFPTQLVSIDETRLWFPDGVRTIAAYLTYYIDSKETNFELTKQILKGKSIKDVAKELNLPYESLVKKVCDKCGSEIENEKKTLSSGCPYCGEQDNNMLNNSFFKCKKCNKLVKLDSNIRDICKKCKSKKFIEKFDTSKILNVDAILISSRHLYRMPYSLHEKTGLCSIPIGTDNILKFDKESARPDSLEISRFKFLEKNNVPKDNARKLFDEARRWFIENTSIKELQEMYNKGAKKQYETPSSSLPETFFPPCIIAILSGIPDGKKRALFILSNFLSKTGWSYDKIEEKIKEWNQKNEEPLREVYIIGQLRYCRQRKESILPPNCDNKGYYVDMRVCSPDNLCRKIKNPVNYAMRKALHSKK